jgi:hypothetical protein
MHVRRHLPVFLLNIPDPAGIPVVPTGITGTGGKKNIFYTGLALIT